MSREIKISETSGISRTGEFIRVAVPLARGELLAGMQLAMIDPAGNPLRTQTKALKHWPDGSVKWLLLDAAVSVAAGDSLIFRFEPVSAFALAGSPVIAVTTGADVWQIDTGSISFSLDVRTFRPFMAVQRKGEELLVSGGSSCLLKLDSGGDIAAEVEAVELEDHGPLHAIVRMAGRFNVSENVTAARFQCRLHFFSGSMAVKLEYTLHNPLAAAHPGGLWDLGDSGSLLFRELALVLPLAAGSVTACSCRAEADLSPVESAASETLSIYQESSGGAQWRSPNHRNRAGAVPFANCGYVIEKCGVRVAEGARATPRVWCGASAGSGIAAALPHFWQEFPKEIVADESQLKIAFFPARFPDRHELQGGEQKATVAALDFAAEKNSLAWAVAPLQVAVSPAAYCDSGVFTDLPAGDDLIDRFTTADALLRKREVVDEFGWRNFGDLYADHEAVYHKGEQSLVSHYNNQYDPLAGFYRKFFASGDPRWQLLAADLARHLLDIDIYHTDLDREEYNRGLFWHTDHYLDAGLSTHRSFSREHLQIKPAHLCGGGPGPEQCYTTGLMLHYFQSGNPDYKGAVIDLADWVLRALEGSQTLLAAVKRGLDYMRLWRENRGRQRLFPRYPLTRGTGNAITACLDAFEVSGERRYIDKADRLIRETLHPDDDITARDLLNAEVSWSYTVLLTAVAKFLEKKSEFAEFDAGFTHARSSLLAYAGWMLQHEYPYLDKPEMLEYPNETWAAQDLRKSVIFYQAARYDDPQRQAFLQKGRLFFDQAREELCRHATSGLTRPVALMLQNGWVGSRLSGEDLPLSSFPAPDELLADKVIECRPSPYLSFGSVLARVGAEMQRAICSTSLQRELAWLKMRLGNSGK